MTAKTTDALVSPVTEQELADWLGADASDPVLHSLLLSATDAVVRSLGYDLNARSWTLTKWDWPVVGTRTDRSVSPAPYYVQCEVQLPYAAIQSVESVKAYGQEVTDFVTREDSIVLPQGIPNQQYKSNENPALLVTYTAGLAPIPASVIDAVKMLSAFLYEHRGECDVMDGLPRSGAAMLLQPYRRNAVVF